MSQPLGSHLLVRSITPTSGQALDVGTINVLIGAHGVGKSEALRDLARLAGNFEPTSADRVAGEEPQTRVIGDVTFVPKLSVDRLLRGIATIEGSKDEGNVAQGIGPDLKTPYRRSVAGELKSILFRPILTARSVWMTSLGEIMPLRVAYLSPDQRTRLVESATAISPLQAPENLLQAFQFGAPEVHEQFDAAIAQIFDGLHARLDATQRVNLFLRTAWQFPPLTGRPVEDAKTYEGLSRLDEQGDGVKSCAAVILIFLLCQGRVILLDQPDAYLQPQHARRLGNWIADHAAKLGTQVFVTTRDAAFMEGLFGGSADVSVLRMSRREDSTRIDLVPPEIGRTLARFPLFSAQSALRCLFDRGVILVAEESDRIVYRTVAERFLRIQDVGFIHAHGGRNLAHAARILRRAQLPTCVAADLDVFQSEQNYSELVKALSQNPPPQPWLATRERLVSHVEGWFDQQELSTSASEVEVFLDQLKQGGIAADAVSKSDTARRDARTKWDRLRQEKLRVLPAELRVWVEELLDEMKRIGLFVSPKGHLQAWMEFGGAEADREAWFNRAIQALDRGECPADLRAFVAEVTAFLQPSVVPPRTARTGHSA